MEKAFTRPFTGVFYWLLSHMLHRVIFGNLGLKLYSRAVAGGAITARGAAIYQYGILMTPHTEHRQPLQQVTQQPDLVLIANIDQKAVILGNRCSTMKCNVVYEYVYLFI